MSRELDSEHVEDFDDAHPFPDKDGVSKLYKFLRFDEAHPERIEDLLLNARLYHCLPGSLNDPFEARPRVILPEGGNQARNARQRIITVARQNGLDRRSAEKEATKILGDRSRLQSVLQDSMDDVYGTVRIASLSAAVDNILMWAHYGAAHSGICIEFDVGTPPFMYAYKVAYQTRYPSLQYPLPMNRDSLRPLLTKSPDWAYEEEYRLLLNPEVPPPYPTDEQFAHLPKESISAIYLGAKISTENRELISDLVNRGPFSPRLLSAKLSESTFSLDFA